MYRSYTELLRFPTFDERFEYLKVLGQVGINTFGYNRFLNQDFYRSKEWKSARQEVIIRDNGSDLGIIDRPIRDQIYVHHINPLSLDDFKKESFDKMFNPEFLISVSFDTHNAIHYGTKLNIKIPIVERKQNDTNLW